MKVKGKYLVEKLNILNEIRYNGMTLQELRFFTIYLSKINSRDISTRLVRFPIEEFKRIMEMKKLNITQLQHTTDSLLQKIVKIPFENGGFKKFQLFKECHFDQDETGTWFIEIDAHDNALPLMFEFKTKYFTYELWNALLLKSVNQLRMYEILKQYEVAKTREIPLDDLKQLLGFKSSEHPRFNNFKVRVLDSCKEALEKYTDIKFDYEPIRYNKKGGEIYAVKFKISKNENHFDPLSLEDFINLKDTPNEEEFRNNIATFLAEACENEFSEEQIRALYIPLAQALPSMENEDQNNYRRRLFAHLKHRHNELEWRATQQDIKYRFSYLKKIIEADAKEIIELDT